MRRDQIRLGARMLFWVALFCAYVVAVIPAEGSPTGNDKTDHILAFAILSMLARLGWSRGRARLIAILLLLFGVAIELSQATPIVHRDADVRDVMADGAGILLGLLIGWLQLQLIRRALPKS